MKPVGGIGGAGGAAGAGPAGRPAGEPPGPGPGRAQSAASSPLDSEGGPAAATRTVSSQSAPCHQSPVPNRPSRLASAHHRAQKVTAEGWWWAWPGPEYFAPSSASSPTAKFRHKRHRASRRPGTLSKSRSRTPGDRVGAAASGSALRPPGRSCRAGRVRGRWGRWRLAPVRAAAWTVDGLSCSPAPGGWGWRETQSGPWLTQPWATPESVTAGPGTDSGQPFESPRRLPARGRGAALAAMIAPPQSLRCCCGSDDLTLILLVVLWGCRGWPGTTRPGPRAGRSTRRPGLGLQGRNLGLRISVRVGRVGPPRRPDGTACGGMRASCAPPSRRRGS